MKLKNFKEPFSIVEDADGIPYAMDFKKYENFVDDPDAAEYDVHPINPDGVILYDQTVKVVKSELTPKWTKLN